MRPSPVGLAVIATVVALALVATWALVTRSGGSRQATGPVFSAAPNGNDSASGSKADPWRTIQHGASTVPPVAGSGLVFQDAGEHELKGVPDRWHLYRVVS